MKDKRLLLALTSVLATACNDVSFFEQKPQTRPVTPMPTRKIVMSEVPPLAPIPVAMQPLMPQIKPTQQQKEAKLKTEYDVVLLALLDSLKQKGDPHYLANAHKIALQVIVPTFKPNEQTIVRAHSVLRHNQARYNGFYLPDFPHWLREQVKQSQITNGQQHVPINDFQNIR